METSEKENIIEEVIRILEQEEPLSSREIAWRVGRSAQSVGRIVRFDRGKVHYSNGLYALDKNKLDVNKDRYQCPYCFNGLRSFLSLIHHVNSRHTGFCPICQEYYKNLITHAKMKSDCKDHYLLYGLISSDQRARSYAEKQCRVYSAYGNDS